MPKASPSAIPRRGPLRELPLDLVLCHPHLPQRPNIRAASGARLLSPTVRRLLADEDLRDSSPGPGHHASEPCQFVVPPPSIVRTRPTLQQFAEEGLVFEVRALHVGAPPALTSTPCPVSSGARSNSPRPSVPDTQSIHYPGFQRHPEHERWRTSSFPLYDDILHLVDRIIATGAGAFHAGSTTSAGPSTPPEAPTTPSGKDKDVEIVMTRVVDPDDDLAPSSPIRPRMRKRAASSSPSTTTPTITKKSRQRNTAAANEVAAAMRSVAAALAVDGSSHGRMRQAAVHRLQEDGDFSSDEESSIMLLFWCDKDASISSTFLAAEPKSRRTPFLCKVLAADEKDT
ncbi:hypothetical protein B0H14DRAFT_3893470 [Mycena olivaceomarginata]|nr:hypothetical protein B0H14DRAFT_3893470 [Mycena olivaceomarginata]